MTFVILTFILMVFMRVSLSGVEDFIKMYVISKIKSPKIINLVLQ
jgi:hypothetical protein